MIMMETQTKQTNQFSLTLLLTLLSIVLLSSLSYAILSKEMTFFVKERYVYMGCLLIVLPLCFACMQMSTYVFDRRYKNDPSGISITLYLIFLWLIFWLAAIPALTRLWSMTVFYSESVLYAPYKHPLSILCLAIFMAFIGCIAAAPGLIRKINTEPGRGERFFWLITLLVGSVLVGSQNVSGLAAISTEPLLLQKWDLNFEPVLYPISQVVAGKTLLVDLPSQYGLYPELIAPFFKAIVKMVGFPISGITFFLAFIEAMSYFALATVFLKITKSRVFRLFWLASSAVLFGFAFQNYPSYPDYDPYNQYFPIRLFFPAISTFLFWQFISVKLRVRNAIAFSVLLVYGSIWNLDSGIPALGSFFTYLMLSAFFAKGSERVQWLKVLMMSVLGAAATFAIFVIYMTLKSGVAVPWSEWLHYQRIFYVSGFAAMPLPRTPHPWMAVVAIYVMGIIGYLRSVAEKPSDNFWKLMLYLSVMGIGLFAYYQHRSHDVVFMAVLWPALFMGYAFTERWLKQIIAMRLPTLWMLAVLPSFMIGAVFCGFFAYKVPTMIGQAKYNWSMAFSNKETQVTENIAYMRSRIPAQDRDSVAIIAWFQGVYFTELGISSAVKGAGTGAAMVGEDQFSLLDRLRAAKPRILFLQKGLMPLLEEAVKKDYQFIDENKNNLMSFRLREDKS